MRVSLPLTIVLSLSVVSATAQNGPAPSAATPQVAQAQGGGRGQGPAGGARGGRGGRGAEAAPPQVLIEGPSLGYVHTLAPLWWPASAGVQESTAGIGTTSRGEIIVYHRPPAGSGRPPLLVFNAQGGLVRTLAADLDVIRAHGLRMDADDNIWITDIGAHMVHKLDLNGKVLLSLGTRGVAGKYDPAAGTSAFNQPTDLDFDGAGNVYIANSHGGPDPRVDKFDRTGKFLTSWRMEPREGPNANNHAIAVMKDGTVFASSREQRLIRVYDSNGKELRSLDMPARVCALYFDRQGVFWMLSGTEGQAMHIDPMTGKVLGVSGRGRGQAIDQFGEAHYMSMAPSGDVYISDTVLNRVVRLTKR